MNIQAMMKQAQKLQKEMTDTKVKSIVWNLQGSHLV